MKEPIWIDEIITKAIHKDQIIQHGGSHFSYQLSVISYQLSVISYELTVISVNS